IALPAVGLAPVAVPGTAPTAFPAAVPTVFPVLVPAVLPAPAVALALGHTRGLALGLLDRDQLRRIGLLDRRELLHGSPFLRARLLGLHRHQAHLRFDRLGLFRRDLARLCR